MNGTVLWYRRQDEAPSQIPEQTPGQIPEHTDQKPDDLSSLPKDHGGPALVAWHAPPTRPGCRRRLNPHVALSAICWFGHVRLPVLGYRWWGVPGSPELPPGFLLANTLQGALSPVMKYWPQSSRCRATPTILRKHLPAWKTIGATRVPFHFRLIFKPSSFICSRASALPRASSTGWCVCLVLRKCLKLVKVSFTSPL